jgi:hypothetical protein
MTATARGTTWDEVCRDAARLPGVVLGTSYRTPALFVRKKLLARLREDGETVAVRTEKIDRDVLLAADPAAFFLTDHYRAHPWILVRLARARPALLMALLEQAWRRTAPRKLVAARIAPG